MRPEDDAPPRNRNPAAGPGGPASSAEAAEFSAAMARDLAGVCERAGLLGLSTLFFAAESEARRALERLDRRARREARHGLSGNAAEGDAA